MQDNSVPQEFELICIIVNFGMGSKVLKIAKRTGITGGTVFLGKGTIKNRILEFLDLTEIRKEIVVLITEKTQAYKSLEVLNKELHLDKPHHGIAFSSSLLDFIGSSTYKHERQTIMSNEKRGEQNTMYHAIITIVDKGNAETVVEAATEAGSKGGTIINARGSGIHETSKLFSMEIEPEKEIVLILSESHLTDQIVSSIEEKLEINKPGNGIIFIQDINKTYGLY